MYLVKKNLCYCLSCIFYFMLLSFNLNSQETSLSIQKYCETALEFYLDRPDLETEFRRRLEFCKTTIKGVHGD